VFEKIPSDRGERWQLMASVINLWLRPLADKDAVLPEELDQAEKRIGHQFPLALREWFQLAGNAHDIWSRQDRLFPHGFNVRNNVLVFCTENQGIWRMGVELGGQDPIDPPVVGWMDEACAGPHEFGQLNSSVSECGLQYLAWAMKYATRNRDFACYLGDDFARNGGRGSWKQDTMSVIQQHCIRCAFPTWRLWGWDNVFYEKTDLLIQVCHSDPVYPQIYVCPRMRASLEWFETAVRKTGFRWSSGRWYA
jgi:hypothetical protein